MEGANSGQQMEQDENAAVRTALQRLHARPRSGIPGSAAAMPPTGLSRTKRKGIPAVRTSSDENGNNNFNGLCILSKACRRIAPLVIRMYKKEVYPLAKVDAMKKGYAPDVSPVTFPPSVW